MAKKKKLSIEYIMELAWSKRGGIVALIGAMYTVEKTNPGTMAKIFGDQWGTTVMTIIGAAIAVTKVLDTNKAQ